MTITVTEIELEAFYSYSGQEILERDAKVLRSGPYIQNGERGKISSQNF